MNENKSDDEYKKPIITGEATVDNKTMKIKLAIDGGGLLNIYELEPKIEQIFAGQCRYNPKKLKVEVHKDKDKLFKGKYKTIIFERQQDSNKTS